MFIFTTASKSFFNTGSILRMTSLVSQLSLLILFLVNEHMPSINRASFSFSFGITLKAASTSASSVSHLKIHVCCSMQPSPVPCFIVHTSIIFTPSWASRGFVTPYQTQLCGIKKRYKKYTHKKQVF